MAALRLAAGRTRIFRDRSFLNINQADCHSTAESVNKVIVSTLVKGLFWLPSLIVSTLLADTSTMAGGKGKYRHLSRDSAHRRALLRNLVTSLFENESITTTWAKAKEAQRLADKLITLGKKNTEASRRKALEIFFVRDADATCYGLPL